MADQSDKEDEQESKEEEHKEEEEEETNPVEHVANVVSDVTVRALREFSTGEMPAGDIPAGTGDEDAGETSQVPAVTGGDNEAEAGDISDYDDDEDEPAESAPQDTSDLLACEGNELDEINDPGFPDQPDDDDLEPDELVVLDPDHPLMVRFQKALRVQLESHNEKLNLAVAETLLALRKKQKEREDIGVELYGVQYELANYQKTLENLQDELNKTRDCRSQTDQQLSDMRNLYSAKQKSLSDERKRGDELRAELENVNLRLFYLENAKNDVRSDIAVMKRAAEKAESEVLRKEESKRVQDLYVNRLVERMDRLREDIALFDAQLEAQAAETRAARELLGEAKMEIEAITAEKKHLYSAWNSALVGMRRRDEAHAAMSDALREQQHRLLTLEAEMDGIRRTIQKEQLENEKLMVSLYRTESELATVKRLLATCQAKYEALKEEFATYSRVLHETEEALQRVNIERTHCTNELNELAREIQAQYREKVRLEDEVMEKIRLQLTADKAAQYTAKIVRRLRERTKDLETQIATTENEIAKTMLDTEQVRSQINSLENKKAELEKEMKAKDDIVAKSQAEIKQRNVEIKRKQDQLQQLSSELDKLVLMAGGAELGPLEIQINSLQKSIDAENTTIAELQHAWLRDQGELVRLSQEHDKQSAEVELMTNKHTILTQKKLRIEAEISGQVAETTDVERDIHRLRIDLLRLNTLCHKEQGNENSLERENHLLEYQFMTELRDAERESIEMQDNLDSIKVEKERLLKNLIEAERQIMLWEKKTQLAKETREAVDADAGQGEMAEMRGEIHRMELRYAQLMKQQEKMIQEMEKSVSHREIIVTRSEAENKKSSKKTVSKGVFHRELAELRRKIKSTQDEANQYDDEIAQKKRQQQELAMMLDERQIQVQQLQYQMDSVDGDLENKMEQKLKNRADLLARQQKTKYYQKLSDGKYQRLCKTAESLQNEKLRQTERMNELAVIVDRLSDEYPTATPALRKAVLAYGSRLQSACETDEQDDDD